MHLTEPDLTWGSGFDSLGKPGPEVQTQTWNSSTQVQCLQQRGGMAVNADVDTREVDLGIGMQNGGKLAMNTDVDTIDPSCIGVHK
jgi:hypothetical protein